MKTVIQSELEKRDRSIYYLSKKLKRNKTLIYNICRGFGRATGPIREKIAAFLGLPVDELFDENGVARKS